MKHLTGKYCLSTLVIFGWLVEKPPEVLNRCLQLQKEPVKGRKGGPRQSREVLVKAAEATQNVTIIHLPNRICKRSWHQRLKIGSRKWKRSKKAICAKAGLILVIEIPQ